VLVNKELLYLYFKAVTMEIDSLHDLSAIEKVRWSLIMHHNIWAYT